MHAAQQSGNSAPYSALLVGYGRIFADRKRNRPLQYAWVLLDSSTRV